MSFYSLKVRGQAQGQNITNTFYYRDEDFSIAAWVADPYSRARALALSWFVGFCLDVDGPLGFTQAAWLEGLPTSYTLTDISVAVKSEGVGFPMETAAPVIIPFSGVTGKHAGAMDGPDRVAVISFGMAYQPASSGLYQPRRRNIRFGPLTSDLLLDNGQIESGMQSLLNNLATKLAAPLTGNTTTFSTDPQVAAVAAVIADTLAIGPAQVLLDIDNVTFVPQGYGQTKVGGVVTLEGYARVVSGAVAPYCSALKSRRTPPHGN